MKLATKSAPSKTSKYVAAVMDSVTVRTPKTTESAKSEIAQLGLFMWIL